MRCDFAFAGGEQIEDVVVTVGGELAVEATNAWLADLAGDDRWQPGMKVLVDYTQAIPGDFTREDLDAVANELSFHADRWGPGLLAVVTDDPAILYGMTPMWQEATKSIHLRTHAFSTHEEARAWLASPHGP
jgi:hypothetical protein